MELFIDYINRSFVFFIGLGASAMMFFIITLLSLVMKVNLSKSLEGGLRMAIALTGMGAIISLLTSQFGPALNLFVERTGSSLVINDLGWAVLALITWSSVYTLLFVFVCLIVNLVMILLKKTNTLNVDLFNIWHLSILGLIIDFYSGYIFISILFVAFIYVLMLKNADVMKPRLNSVLNYDSKNITTTAHPAFLFNPIVLIFNKIIDRLLPSIDKLDFNADTLNQKIGFWGSKFAIGTYLGIFVGLLSNSSLQEMLALSFIGGVCIELFGIVGSWFGPAIEPLSQGVTRTMTQKFGGRKLYIGIDWAIVGTRAEIWATANILAPFLIVIALFLRGNQTLPLGGIIMTCLVPSLLLITQGKIIRMTLIGIISIPLYLWAATEIAEFTTQTSLSLGTYPSGLPDNSLFTSIEAIPIEKLIALWIGRTAAQPTYLSLIMIAGALILYSFLFLWYFKAMEKETSEEKKAVN
ncbi:hypothetical protein O2K51_00290 [Apibacter raozihei]|uniref:PTS galactitol transporter subunit IIC n=1 Tax=Apibacter TaxID=1778601 RepID=UPI000FE41258|nr:MULTISPECIES: PTS transporter subunit IIC [Apibacter]